MDLFGRLEIFLDSGDFQRIIGAVTWTILGQLEIILAQLVDFLLWALLRALNAREIFHFFWKTRGKS